VYFLLAPAVALWSEEGQKDEQSRLTDWRETLLYGLDTEVMGVLEDIKTTNETGLNRELAQIFSTSIKTDIRVAVLDFFWEQKDRLIETQALAALKEYEDQESDLVTALIRYLSVIGSGEIMDLLKKLLQHEDAGIASGAIRALREEALRPAVGEDFVKLLLDKLEDDGFEEKLKPEIILTLGALKNRAAVEYLISVLEDRENASLMRMYAADSLGEIGDDRAIPVLKSVFIEKDALLRAYAASALSNFDINEVIDLLMEGLRDSNWRVRVASAKGLAHGGAKEALATLLYRARKDPARDVRLETFKALGSIAEQEGLDLLREIYLSEGESLEIRTAALEVLIKSDPTAAIAAIGKIVERDLNKPLLEARILEYTAKLLSRVQEPALKEIFKKFLRSPNLAVKIQGIRGIAANRFSDLRAALAEMSEKDPHPGVRKEARTAIEKW
ncbi:MAG TPA: HEAT repeat domain-containing protein, partial [Spirochaetia bacterium]|nr:HEAT repeat domain-containing protein [Spirochaetia bacterium]